MEAMNLLTPMDIHNHQFKKSIRGYNENEVDDFLDKIVVDFEKLLRENERLQNDLNLLEVEIDKYRRLEKTMNDTLLMAQRTADDVISAARKNADEMKENTARECQNIREQARIEADKQIEAANAKRDAILEDYSKLVSEKNSFLLKMRTMLESELAITNHVIELLPKVDEAAKAPAPENKPVEKPKPVEPPKVEEIPAPVEEVKSNIVDISSKPVEKKTVALDGTRTYNFAKKSSAPEEGSSK